MIFQWPFQEPKLEVPAYVIKGLSPQNMAYMVLTYLQFRILEFPMNIWLCPIYCVKLSEGQWTLVIFVSCRVAKISHSYNCTTRLLPWIHLLTCCLMKARDNMLQHATTVYSWFWSSESLLEFKTIKLSYVVNQKNPCDAMAPLMLGDGSCHPKWGCYSTHRGMWIFYRTACNLWRGWTPLWGQVGWRKAQKSTEDAQNVWPAGSGKFWPCSNEVFGVSAPMFFEPFPKLVDDTNINLGNPWSGIGMDFKDLTMDVVLVHTQASFLGLQGIHVLLWDSDWQPGIGIQLVLE